MSTLISYMKTYRHDICKHIFIETIEYKSKHDENVKVFTKSGIVKYISYMKEGGTSQHSDLLEEDGEDILILKRMTSKQPIMQVIPIDEMFDIIADAIKIFPTCKSKELFGKIRSKYVIPHVCEKEFVRILKQDYSKSKVCMQCGILNINGESDNNFNFVLTCIDTSTSYVYFRPLMTKNHNEIGVELMKLFLDIGIPRTIEVDSVTLFDSIFNYIKNTFFSVGLPRIVYKKQACKYIISTKALLKEISDWMTRTKSSNWVVGISYVQWLLNTRNSKHYDEKILNKPCKFKSHISYYNHFDVLPKFTSIVQDFNRDSDVEDYSSSFLKCHACECGLYKPITCDICKGSVHYLCTTRKIIKSGETLIIKVTCFLCLQNTAVT